MGKWEGDDLRGLGHWGPRELQRESRTLEGELEEGRLQGLLAPHRTPQVPPAVAVAGGRPPGRRCCRTRPRVKCFPPFPGVSRHFTEGTLVHT